MPSDQLPTDPLVISVEADASAIPASSLPRSIEFNSALLECLRSRGPFKGPESLNGTIKNPDLLRPTLERRNFVLFMILPTNVSETPRAEMSAVSTKLPPAAR